MTKVIFQDFPGPGILKKKNPGLSKYRGSCRTRKHALHVYSLGVAVARHMRAL